MLNTDSDQCHVIVVAIKWWPCNAHHLLASMIIAAKISNVHYNNTSLIHTCITQDILIIFGLNQSYHDSVASNNVHIVYTSSFCGKTAHPCAIASTA